MYNEQYSPKEPEDPASSTETMDFLTDNSGQATNALVHQRSGPPLVCPPNSINW